MLVLGLDPGLAITGYGLVEGDGQELVSVAYGLLDEYHPDETAVEELFFSANARTAIVVGEARGVLLLTLAQAGLDVSEYTPLQIKQAITGYGRADKEQVQQMVRLLLRLEDIPRPDDAADALAVAICHHHSARLTTLLKQ